MCYTLLINAKYGCLKQMHCQNVSWEAVSPSQNGCVMKRWVDCFHRPQQASDDQHSPEPLLDFITLQLLIINLHPTGLWWPKCAIMGLAWKMAVHCQTVQNRLQPLTGSANEFVSLSLHWKKGDTCTIWAFCIKGMIFIAQESTWEWNSTAQLVQTKLILHL